MDVAGLADSVASVLSLSIHGGVPVTVVEHHSVGPGQIDPDAAAAGWQNEAEDASICIEALHECLVVACRRQTEEMSITDRLQLSRSCLEAEQVKITLSKHHHCWPVSAPPGCCRPDGGRCVRGSWGTAPAHPAFESSEWKSAPCGLPPSAFAATCGESEAYLKTGDKTQNEPPASKTSCRSIKLFNNRTWSKLFEAAFYA